MQISGSEPKRNTNLDALRGVAILMVLGRHSSYFATFWSRAWVKTGWAGVDLFFVLSGFLVSGLLFDAYKRDGRIGFSRFFIRRGLKIWPAFYFLIVTGVIVDAVQGIPIARSHLLSEVFFMQSYFEGIWGVTWSLAVEEHFYLLLPVILLVMARLDSEKPFAWMPHVFLTIAVLCLAARFAAGWGVYGDATLYPTHLRLDGLMFGVLLSFYKRFRPEVFARIARSRAAWVLIIAAVILLAIYRDEDSNMHTWGFTVNYLAAGCLIAKAVTFEGPVVIRFLSSMLARMGVYSYSIYLWHPFFKQKVLAVAHLQLGTLWFWCYIGGSILFGIAAARVIEIPVLRFRDKVFPGRSPVAQAVGVSSGR